MSLSSASIEFECPPSPQLVKKLARDLKKEDKMEASHVKDLLDDLARTEKAHAKVEKALHKAENALAKAEKKELEAVEAANKATHRHDIAVANLRNAEQDEELKERQDAKLIEQIEEKKVKVVAALKDQATHHKEREAKLAEVKGLAQPAANADSSSEESLPLPMVV